MSEQNLTLTRNTECITESLSEQTTALLLTTNHRQAGENKQRKKNVKSFPSRKAHRVALLSYPQRSARHQLTLPDHECRTSAPRGVFVCDPVFAITHYYYFFSALGSKDPEG